MSQRRSIPAGKILLMGAAAVQGAQYVYAFQLVHSGSLPALATAGGILAGGVIVGVIAYAGGRLAGIRSKRARAAAWAAFLPLLVISPLILTPVNWYSMDSSLRAAIGGYGWILAGLIASAPELAIALLAFADRALIPAAQPATPAAQSARRAPRAAAQPAKSYACSVPGCSYKAQNQHALAAHMSHHNRRARADQLAGALFENVKGTQ